MKFTNFVLIVLLGSLTQYQIAAGDSHCKYDKAYGSKTRECMYDIYYDLGENKQITVYCECKFNADKNSDSKGKLDCGGKNVIFDTGGTRGIVNWEHVVPKSWLGNERAKTDAINLLPSIGALNQKRWYYPYGSVNEEPRKFGCDCDFEVEEARAEPRINIRGDIARIHFYMEKAYENGWEIHSDFSNNLSKDGYIKMLQGRSTVDDIDPEECERIKMTLSHQHHKYRPPKVDIVRTIWSDCF